MKTALLISSLLLPLLLAAAASVSAQQPAPVTVALPEVQPAVEQVELTGSFTARRSARLSPRLSGLVEQVAVEAGDAVEAGQLLFRLDDRLARLEQAQADAAVAEAQAALDEALRLRDEGRKLRGDRFLPETEVRARESAAQVAQAALDVAQAARDTAAELVARHAVVAPFSGVIAERLTEAGEWVQTGTAVASLVAVDELWLDVQAPQRLWPRLDQRTEVEVMVDALGGTAYPAQVAARVPVSNQDARTFLLRLVLSDAVSEITPGMSARARLRLSSATDALLVPRDALIRYPDGTITLFVVERDSNPPRVRQRQVTLGTVQGDRAVIAAGLEPDLAVVVRGNEALADGDPVRIVDADGS
jgi:RND family efflux transporter MFP subunit